MPRSAARRTFLDRELPKYINLSTVGSFWPLTVMVGSESFVWGAG